MIGVYDMAGNVIETQEHKGDFKGYQHDKMFAPPPSVCNPEPNIAGRKMATEPEPKKIFVIRSVWRRLKKGHFIKVGRDLQPAKDVKGGGGVADKSKPNTSGTGSMGNQ